MITVYTQPLCAPCKQAIKMLEDSGVEYQVFDIRQDEVAYRHVKSIGAAATPVISNGDEFVIGFTPETKPQIQKMIDAESAPTIYGDGTWMH